MAKVVHFPNAKVDSEPKARRPKKKEKDGAFRRKWGGVVEKTGYTQVPDVLIERQQALGIDSTDFNILLQLLVFWWERERLPFPSKGLIAKRVGISARRVQERLGRLEADGLITRDRRPGDTHIYRLDGLLGAVTRLAKDELIERAENAQAKVARSLRKRPRV